MERARRGPTRPQAPREQGPPQPPTLGPPSHRDGRPEGPAPPRVCPGATSLLPASSGMTVGRCWTWQGLAALGSPHHPQSPAESVGLLADAGGGSSPQWEHCPGPTWTSSPRCRTATLGKPEPRVTAGLQASFLLPGMHCISPHSRLHQGVRSTHASLSPMRHLRDLPGPSESL